MATHKVGGEVDAFCTRCKMTLAHTILAMVGTKIARVRCNTCGGDHAYRAEPGARSSSPRAASTASRARSTESAPKVTVSFQDQLAGRDLSAAPMYSPKLTFTMDQVVNHPTFGYGIVTAVRGDKVDIAFKGQQKTLIHGRGDAAPGAKPAFQPPSGRSSLPADKPAPVEGSDAPEEAGDAADAESADAAAAESEG